MRVLSQRIAYYKVPSEVLFVDEVPLTVTGKPQKFLMREMMSKKLTVKDVVQA